MLLDEKWLNEFKITPNSRGGYDLYRLQRCFFYNVAGSSPKEPVDSWRFVTSYKYKWQARKYIAHLAQPDEYIIIPNKD